MPKFMDFHPNFQISPERVAQLRQEMVEGTVDQYGVRQLELFHSPDGLGVYCLLEGPDEVAVRNHHHGNCGEVIRVESLR
jgi:quinol monooxygenase YgiN